MEHVVFYPSADGAPAFRRVASLEEAVRFVEHLRNIEDVSDFSVHELTQVPLSFKAYYKAEVPAPVSDELPAVEVPAVAAPAEAVEMPEAVGPAEPVAEEAREAPAVAEMVEELPVADVPAPAESTESAAPAESRKSLSFFAR